MTRLLAAVAIVAGATALWASPANAEEEHCYRSGVWTSTAKEHCENDHQVVALCLRLFTKITVAGPAVAGGEWSEVTCPTGYRVASIS